MRSVRALGIALAVTTLLPSLAHAQELGGRPFKDSWFWGVKAGATTYGNTTNGSGTAPLAGADWLITRTNGGIYVSYTQAFLTQTTSVDTLDATDTNAPHQIALKGLRRIEFAAMAFPQFTTKVHPYIGLGISVQQVGSATASNSGLSSAQQNAIADTIQTRRTSLAPLLIAGVQVRVPYVSVFAQGAVSSTQNTFFLNGSTASVGLEIGVRYNIGSSIED